MSEKSALRRRCAANFKANREGVAAIEFAFLAPLFFTVVFAIFEIGMISISQSSMRSGLSELARVVRTGTGQCLTDQQAIDRVCAIARLADCKSELSIERAIWSAGISGGASTASEFKDMQGATIVMLRAAYDWNIVNPLMEPFLAHQNGVRTLTQSVVFMNEDFDNAACS